MTSPKAVMSSGHYANKWSQWCNFSKGRKFTFQSAKAWTIITDLCCCVWSIITDLCFCVWSTMTDVCCCVEDSTVQCVCVFLLDILTSAWHKVCLHKSNQLMYPRLQQATWVWTKPELDQWLINIAHVWAHVELGYDVGTLGTRMQPVGSAGRCVQGTWWPWLGLPQLHGTNSVHLSWLSSYSFMYDFISVFICYSKSFWV